MKSKNPRLYVLSALFAALTCVFTAYVKVPTGINQGYIHLGDAVIYLAASLLPPSFAAAAASIGGGLADIFAGATNWVWATIIIKALNIIPFALIHRFTKKSNYIFSVKGVVASILSGVITIVGYFTAEAIMYGLNAAYLSLPFNFIQPAGSTLLFCVLSLLLDRTSFKSRIEKGDF